MATRDRDGVYEGDAEFDWLMELADEIGQNIEKGILPPQDENGFYILP